MDPLTDPSIEIVVPVYNEELALPRSIATLVAFLNSGFPYRWRIVIADNASTDATPQVARDLCDRYEQIAYLRVDEKGRGRALKTAWSASDAPVLCYMDVDLSTGLRALLPLVAPLVTGHAGVAIGSRLLGESRVIRGRKRETLSRGYNLIIRAAFRPAFHDAQCGFKAIRADVAGELIPLIEDNAWFFDTELLLLAGRNGIRVVEVPVDWVDDPDSRVQIGATVAKDLSGLWRMRRTFWSGGGRLTSAGDGVPGAHPELTGAAK